MKILAFAGSNSSESINRQLVQYALKQIKGHTHTLLDLNNFEMPIYSMDREKSDGIPQLAKDFIQQIQSHDAIVCSLAEHNASYSTAFKNILDWCSRSESKFLFKKPLFLMGTSPGKGGAKHVLAAATAFFPFIDGNITQTFSLPSFNQNFGESGITNPELKKELENKISSFLSSLPS